MDTNRKSTNFLLSPEVFYTKYICQWHNANTDLIEIPEYIVPLIQQNILNDRLNLPTRIALASLPPKNKIIALLDNVNIEKLLMLYNLLELLLADHLAEEWVYIYENTEAGELQDLSFHNLMLLNEDCVTKACKLRLTHATTLREASAPLAAFLSSSNIELRKFQSKHIYRLLSEKCNPKLHRLILESATQIPSTICFRYLKIALDKYLHADKILLRILEKFATENIEQFNTANGYIFMAECILSLDRINNNAGTSALLNHYNIYKKIDHPRQHAIERAFTYIISRSHASIELRNKTSDLLDNFQSFAKQLPTMQNPCDQRYSSSHNTRTLHRILMENSANDYAEQNFKIT